MDSFGSVAIQRIFKQYLLFIPNSNLSNYADNNTMYAISKNLHVVKSYLETNLLLCRNDFYENHMVFWQKNPGKCRDMLIDNHDDPDKINLHGTEITSSSNKKLLGVRIDKKLSCDIHLKSLCKKEGQNFCALAKICSYLTLD